MDMVMSTYRLEGLLFPVSGRLPELQNAQIKGLENATFATEEFWIIAECKGTYCKCRRFDNAFTCVIFIFQVQIRID
jgi:hypothetical protein